ncbi:C39 family peptidase [Helicobacter sp. 13S00477-4]|uniref:C39 family peptidase n=1 Tax=Helicobacter sp. 13S00477-4 TaxID=1905759 RepID=UPI0021508B71|nr:C39 family peptidase [Helicobacter sp. 13S00477-4]
MKYDNVILEKSPKSWIEFKNDNLVRQEYDYTCGSASLATILKYYYSVEVTESDIIKGILKSKGYDSTQNEVLKEGDNIISFLDLSEYARKNGFRAVGLAIDFEALKKLKIPAIIFVNVRNIGHFSVYKAMDEEYVYLSDPSFGNIKVRLSQFKEMFYQRNDGKHPGKILVILPQKDNLNVSVNRDFMGVKKDSSFTYEVIKEKMIYQRILH